ncbi:MAG: transposase [Promethearchaeota archaeon]
MLDCHTDPNYGKDTTPYIIKGRNKASTHRAFWYMTLLWANAPKPITLGVKLMQHPRQFYQDSQEVLAPWLTTEQIIYVLADGDYYNWDLVRWLQSQGVSFIIRGQINHGVKPLVAAYQEELQLPNNGSIVPYLMKQGHRKTPCPVKLLLWREHTALLAFVLPPTSQLSAREARTLYRHRFIIETYYRMMHRFQPFSCSQHPNIRYILVCLAFWLCNLWCYFKAPLNMLKNVSRRAFADKTYPAKLFCEYVYESWLISIR